MKSSARLLVLTCNIYLLIISALMAQDQSKIKEPESLDQFFFLDATGDIKTLERQTPKGLEIKGNRSPVRFVQGEPLAFVVRLSSQTVDPATIFQFFKLNANGKNRVLEMIIGGPKKDIRYAGVVAFEATKYGENSFKIKSRVDLGPGEYALGLSTKKDGNGFGVDAVKTDLK